MVSLLFIFVSSFLIALSGALMPGPMLTITIKESLSLGWRAGFLISSGHGLAELAIIVLFALGLNRLLQTPWISAVVGISGGVILLWMGAGIIRSLGEKLQLAGGDSPPSETVTSSNWRALREGVLVSVANPGWAIWWFSIGIAYVTMALKQGWIALGSFYTGHILADFTWYVLIAAAVSAGRKFIGDRAYRGLLAVCGVLLLGLAVYFMGQGVHSAVLILKH